MKRSALQKNSISKKQSSLSTKGVFVLCLGLVCLTLIYVNKDAQEKLSASTSKVSRQIASIDSIRDIAVMDSNLSESVDAEENLAATSFNPSLNESPNPKQQRVQLRDPVQESGLQVNAQSLDSQHLKELVTAALSRGDIRPDEAKLYEDQLRAEAMIQFSHGMYEVEDDETNMN